MEILTAFEIRPTVDDILLGQGIDPSSKKTIRPAIFSTAEQALLLGRELIKPVVLLQETEIISIDANAIRLIDGLEFPGTRSLPGLAGSQKIAVAICTIGPDLEEFSSTSMKTDPLLGFALEGLANVAVEILGRRVCELVAHRAHSQGLEPSSPHSPGSTAWPVETGQPQVFSLLNASLAGVQLTPSKMMIPRKTISFIIGLGHSMRNEDECALCAYRERCHYRHA